MIVEGFSQTCFPPTLLPLDIHIRMENMDHKSRIVEVTGLGFVLLLSTRVLSPQS